MGNGPRLGQLSEPSLVQWEEFFLTSQSHREGLKEDISYLNKRHLTAFLAPVQWQAMHSSVCIAKIRKSKETRVNSAWLNQMEIVFPP